ncbi:ABC transporter permease [Parasediminibacterium sp. JCM 36343]|uniref:ABC transporter permease n=1 Tax=Parasediminibacterium sp. JCM 36343 TaxID=3374279 RepID=UPI00397A4241
MKTSVNLEIAFTHIFTRRKQTMVAALGVTVGVAIYLFMNSLSGGFSQYSRNEMFKSSAHIKIYKSDEISKPLGNSSDTNTVNVIVNPQITTLSKTIINPNALLGLVKQEPYITNAIAQVDFAAFYNRGQAQVKGTGNGVDMVAYNAMFNTQKYMVAGNIKALQGNVNGIIIGKGIAEKLSLGLNDNISVSSSKGVSKVLRIVGIFNTGSSITDDSKSYVNISTAQQFLKEGTAYLTTIYANTLDADNSETYVSQLQTLTPYTIEGWKTTYADVLAGDKVRGTMMGAISLSILLVAGFGIYNILNMTVSQKIGDIAILKATGFLGSDVIKIFVSEAIMMGLLGTTIGLCFGAILINIMAHIYVGGPVGYFPIHFQLDLFLQSFFLGLFITICSGYFPARKASKVDPVAILRR